MWSAKEEDLLIDRIKQVRPELICFSARSFMDKANMKLLPDVKKAVPECVLLAGGYGPTCNPELYADIVNKCIYVVGGGALLRGLTKRLTDKISIPFIMAEDPLHAVARGTGIALKNVDKFSFLMR